MFMLQVASLAFGFSLESIQMGKISKKVPSVANFFEFHCNWNCNILEHFVPCFIESEHKPNNR